MSPEIKNLSARIGENFWHFRNKYLVIKPGDMKSKYTVYSKYKNGKLEGFLYEAENLRSLVKAMDILNEDVDMPVVQDLEDCYEEC